MLHFQRRGSQLLDSSTKTCERKERKKKQLTSTASKEKKNQRKHWETSFYRDLKQNAFFCLLFMSFFVCGSFQ